MRPYSPGGLLSTFASVPESSEILKPSRHRLGPGLPGYLIPFAPLAFAPQRQVRPSRLSSPLAFPWISTISPLHPEFHRPLPASRRSVCTAIPRLSRGISQDTLPPAYAPFKPSDSEQRLPPLYYRGCWHRVSRGFLWDSSTPRIIYPSRLLTPDSSLHPEGLPPARGVAPSGLRPLRKIRYCSLP